MFGGALRAGLRFGNKYIFRPSFTAVKMAVDTGLLLNAESASA
jgi:hypothetical protein